MAFDALTVSAITAEMKTFCLEGRITKINQPERDEINLTVKGPAGVQRIVLSANASLPLFYIDNESKRENPVTAYNFCMVLRKHLQNGIIQSIRQIDRDRIVEFSVSHYDELGDLKENRLIVELMGKYSNLILVNPENRVLESIKHVNHSVSSMREVFPGSTYFRVLGDPKAEITETEDSVAEKLLRDCPKRCRQALVHTFRGIAPKTAEEICWRAGLDSDRPTTELTDEEIRRLIREIRSLTETVDAGRFDFKIYYDGEKPIDYAVLPMSIYGNLTTHAFDTVSDMLVNFYREKRLFTRRAEKTTELRQILNHHIERVSKKLSIWEQQIQDCSKKDRFKTWGELVIAYAHQVEPGAEKVVCQDWNQDYAEVTIPLDPTLTASENSQRYYEKYNKMKRTETALNELLEEGREELAYLESVAAGLKHVESQGDLKQIRSELEEGGYVKRRFNKTDKQIAKSRPLHYRDEDGYDYYVGKNNLQNEEVTFKIGDPKDWWFHVKTLAGSHVIVKSKGEDELPDAVYLRAASLAAYYSSASEDAKVEVDYIPQKHLKKPKTRKPGMVIYHTNWSMIVSPSKDGLELISD